jgi:serine/threonine protein phosphatase PrpC
MIGSSNSGLSQYKPQSLYDWIVSGSTVKGLAHIYSGRPNQDSIRWLNEPFNEVKILSIADGHGSAKYFRSKIGSQAATKVSVKVFNNLFRTIDLTQTSITQLRDIIRYTIPRHIVRNWNEMVTSHLIKNPISDIELIKELGECREEISSMIAINPLMIYGSTSITIVVTNNFIFCLQIGDGDIVIVDKERNLVRPFASNSLSTNKPSISSMDETNSLCMNNSWNNYDVKIYSTEELQPRLVLASTDGYSNSFRNLNGFLKIGTDYLDLLDNRGPVYLKKKLSQILRKTSDEGSGDDITLGFFYRKIP